MRKSGEKNKTTENRKRFNAMKTELLKIKDKAKKIHYTNLIEKCGNNQKLLFELLNEMRTCQVLPDNFTVLTNLFNENFLDKIEIECE